MTGLRKRMAIGKTKTPACPILPVGYPPETEISFYMQDKSIKKLAKVMFAQ